jgi:hypothetical protein
MRSHRMFEVHHNPHIKFVDSIDNVICIRFNLLGSYWFYCEIAHIFYYIVQCFEFLNKIKLLLFCAWFFFCTLKNTYTTHAYPSQSWSF